MEVDPLIAAADAQAAQARRGDWRVTTVDGQALAAVSRATLRLGTDGRIGGQAGCNVYSGTYTLEGGRFNLGQLVTDAPVERPSGGVATTRMACTPVQMADERRFLGVLERANALAWREGDVLTLSTPDGHAIEARRP